MADSARPYLVRAGAPVSLQAVSGTTAWEAQIEKVGDRAAILPGRFLAALLHRGQQVRIEPLTGGAFLPPGGGCRRLGLAVTRI